VLENSIFGILALFLVMGSLGMILFKQSVFSAISFLLAMIALSGMFALLDQSFLFLAQILVSVGAIVTLALLVIVSVNIKDENLPKNSLGIKHTLLMIALISPIIFTILYVISSSNLEFSEVSSDFGTLKLTGKILFSEWVLPFETISILLLVALIGGIVISKRGDSNESR
jgi:NADH-quinone oxidoreductase subunit J